MTPHAFVLVPFGIALLLFSREWLYRCLIVSVVFSGTAVFNVGSGPGASGVQLWMFFGSLWLLRDVVSRLATGNVSFRRNMVLPVSLVACFLCIVTLSLMMPEYINGRLQIESPYLTDISRTPLFFSVRHVTAWLYLIMGGLLSVSIALENRILNDLVKTARIYLWSGVFMSLWGFFQLFTAFAHIPYPAFLFNNSASPGATGYASYVPDIAWRRMSSVAVEPSVLSEVLLTIIALTIPSMLKCGYMISPRADRCCFMLFGLALIVSTSSSAYLGLLILALATLTLAARTGLRNRGSMLKLAALLILGIPICFLLLYAELPLFRAIMDFSLFSKATSFSALERLKTIQNARAYFIQYPVLGVGWGSVTSHDLLFKLLSDIGVLGFLSFAAMVLWPVLRLYRAIRERQDPMAITQMAWLLSLIMLILINAIGGFAYMMGHFWMILGMTMSCASLSKGVMAEANEGLRTSSLAGVSGA